MAPPPSTVVSPVVALIVRVLTFACLVVSGIVIATNNVDTLGGKIKFTDFYAYRYMLATVVIGMAYTLIQIAFTVILVTTGKRFGGDGLIYVDFFGDKALSYMLATGAAAAFGLTVDLKRGNGGGDSGTDSYLNKGNAAASILFIGFLFSAASSIFSSLSLSNRS